MEKREHSCTVGRNVNRYRLYGRQYAAAAKSLQSYPTLCNPMDCSLLGSSVHGIFQAKILGWGAIAFSDHCTNLRRAENKRKKEFSLEAWVKETSNTVSFFFFFLKKRQRNSP